MMENRVAPEKKVRKTIYTTEVAEEEAQAA